MRISVEQRHIDRGIPGDSKNCPIAQYLRETEIEFRHVSQNIKTCRSRNHGGKIIFSPYNIKHFPGYVAQRLDDFDNGLAIKPFTFETLD